MKIVLIDPPTSFEQIYGDWDLSALDTYCPPLGLLSMAAYVRAHGHEPQVIDMDARKWDVGRAVAHTLAAEPGIVGISAKTINIFNAARIAGALKAAGCKGRIVLGGAHVTAVPEETMKRFTAFDCAVLGEGEEALLELAESAGRGRHDPDIRGLAWRDGRGRVAVNQRREPIQDLDALPFPAWDLLPDFPHSYPHNALETKRLPAAAVITSRGCPFHCTFCDTAVFGSRVRQHGAEYTLEMIRRLRSDYGIRDLMFLDDNFTLDRRKLFTICDTMIREDLRLSWYCMGHARTLTDDRLRKMRAAGCWIVEIGIESGSDRILASIQKGTTKAEVAQAVRRARDAGLKVKGNFIFGFPGETRETLSETIDFASRIGLSYFQQSFLTIWPGCALAAHAEEFGRLDQDWNRLAHQRITFVPNGLSEGDLTRASKQAFRKFYLRPRVILEFAVHALGSWRAWTNTMMGFLIFIRTVFRKPPAERPALPAWEEESRRKQAAV